MILVVLAVPFLLNWNESESGAQKWFPSEVARGVLPSDDRLNALEDVPLLRSPSPSGSAQSYGKKLRSFTGHLTLEGGSRFIAPFIVVQDDGLLRGPIVGADFCFACTQSECRQVVVRARGYRDVTCILDFGEDLVANLGEIVMIPLEEWTLTVLSTNGEPVGNAVIHAHPESNIADAVHYPTSTVVTVADQQGHATIAPLSDTWLWARDPSTGNISRPMRVALNLDQPLELVISDDLCDLTLTVSGDFPPGLTTKLPVEITSLQRGRSVMAELEPNRPVRLELPFGTYSLAVDSSPFQVIEPLLFPGEEGIEFEVASNSIHRELFAEYVDGWHLELVSESGSDLSEIDHIDVAYRVSSGSVPSREVFRRSLSTEYSAGVLRAYMPNSSGFDESFPGDLSVVIRVAGYQTISLPLPLGVGYGSEVVAGSLNVDDVEGLQSGTFVGHQEQLVPVHLRIETPGEVAFRSIGGASARHSIPIAHLRSDSSLVTHVASGVRPLAIDIGQLRYQRPHGMVADLKEKLGTLVITATGDDLDWLQFSTGIERDGQPFVHPAEVSLKENRIRMRFDNLYPGRYDVRVRRPDWPSSLSVGDVEVFGGDLSSLNVRLLGQHEDQFAKIALPRLPNDLGHFEVVPGRVFGPNAARLDMARAISSAPGDQDISCPRRWVEREQALLVLSQPALAPIPIEFLDDSGVSVVGEFCSWMPPVRLTSMTVLKTDLSFSGRLLNGKVIHVNGWASAGPFVLPKGEYSAISSNPSTGDPEQHHFTIN